jgi:hypothetical protein
MAVDAWEMRGGYPTQAKLGWATRFESGVVLSQVPKAMDLGHRFSVLGLD